MARMNINILGISELKWTAMGEFNSDDHHIYYCRQEPLRRNRAAIIVNKRVQNAVLMCSLKDGRTQGKPFNITVIQPHATVIQPQIPKKLKLTGSMKTYNTF